jgi:hypothetical protein
MTRNKIADKLRAAATAVEEDEDYELALQLAEPALILILERCSDLPALEPGLPLMYVTFNGAEEADRMLTGRSI